jgi:lipopolysaccharide biosynthesis protein
MWHAAVEVQRIMADERTALTPSSSMFWVLVAALKRFVEEEGKGNLPIEVLS